jgi:hypothetical protein
MNDKKNYAIEIKEVDLKYVLPYLSDFGKIVYVVTMPKIRQALVEMETLES